MGLLRACWAETRLVSPQVCEAGFVYLVAVLVAVANGNSLPVDSVLWRACHTSPGIWTCVDARAQMFIGLQVFLKACYVGSVSVMAGVSWQLWWVCGRRTEEALWLGPRFAKHWLGFVNQAP